MLVRSEWKSGVEPGDFPVAKLVGVVVVVAALVTTVRIKVIKRTTFLSIFTMCFICIFIYRWGTWSIERLWNLLEVQVLWVTHLIWLLKGAAFLGLSLSIILRVGEITGCDFQLDDLLLCSVFLFFLINSIDRPTCWVISFYVQVTL